LIAEAEDEISLLKWVKQENENEYEEEIAKRVLQRTEEYLAYLRDLQDRTVE
jgi:hypothetical protein